MIIRFSSIGDIVLTTPLLRCIKAQLPGVQIHYLTKKSYKPVLQANPNIDKLHLLDQSLNTVIKELKEENFDFIVDLHKNIRSLRVKYALHKPSATFNKLNIQKWLITRFKIDRLPSVHIVDRYFEAVHKINVENDGKGLDYFIPEEEEIDIRKEFPQVKSYYYTWVIGGQHTTKIFPPEKIIAILQKTLTPVILLGGKEDRERGALIETQSPEYIINAAGKYSLNQSASILRQSTKVFTNDTGLMHIAAAFQKEIISFWGNTIPAFGMYPYLPGKQSKIFEVQGLSCRPCSKIGYDKCPKKHFRCMHDIPNSEVDKHLL